MSQNRTTPITIFDVAKRAGVSYSTVSRVVNNYPFIKPSTRTKVQAAMEELGYVANLKARSLAGGRSQIIGVLIYDLNTNYSVEVVRGIDEEVSSSDYDMILSTTHHRSKKEADHVAKLAQGLVDGLLIILPSNLNAYVDTLESQGYPFVLIDHEGLQRNGSFSIQATNYRGGYDATRHLLDLGHRRIAIVAGPYSQTAAVSSAADRLSGYYAALQEAHIDRDTDLIYEGDFSFEAGQSSAHKFLDLADPPTAIFACSDEAAFGVIAVAQTRGLDVPGDLSVIGFDDIPEAAYHRPALTTIHQPLREMGRRATRMLIDHLEGTDSVPPRIELPTRLKHRATTNPPNKKTGG